MLTFSESSTNANRESKNILSDNNMLLPALKSNILLVPIGPYDANPGGQANFYGGHIIVLI